ncbi:uncharacterized protein MONOS_970 [Monocercomonoides exilis]|uniref:uncharacterized protein n=1 Tax=Monocercomonoides exilis TaxID=2049356 RepID=UPI0035594D2B|nr:hypothetical protein MONOS_970 [Monocercomonoides exilis]|eukprot:MONOS_970.1-p1 / transcript=MONOS_970.1 / gene=MONOS_970 / organism=Monocercomonoides_exilis_PA203 / gene_product=unspecified product / transcript_product=unspecified product / location=Mono_scaffold00016:104092-104576(+) / protein_length=123 / sequence_SO=supercontig / SO=protein_coding / is_pseudo=false
MSFQTTSQSSNLRNSSSIKRSQRGVFFKPGIASTDVLSVSSGSKQANDEGIISERKEKYELLLERAKQLAGSISLEEQRIKSHLDKPTGNEATLCALLNRREHELDEIGKQLDALGALHGVS